MRLIDADALGNRMYHESFEKDSDLQRWDGGCWIRYKLFEQVLRAAPTIDPTHPTSSNTLGALDCVERQFEEIVVEYPNITDEEHKGKPYYSIKYIENGEDKIIGFGTYKIEVLSRYIRDYFIQSVQLDRDIAIKPIETTDRAWGIPNKQAVCPKCDYYLSHISFLGDYKGKRITYCETCGQAIDWEGWDWDEED